VIGMMERKRTMNCAPRPCASCPYRKDSPSGLWAGDEYAKLLAYDGDMLDQLAMGATATFGCHQKDGNLCAGWVAAHGAENLLSLRVQGDKVPPETWNYTTDVEVFASGREAFDHGIRDLQSPGPKALRLMAKMQAKGVAL
jgi:hypothetical protein